MRLLRTTLLASALILPLAVSCTNLRAPSVVKAGYEAETEESWASRYLPGVRTLSRLVPPPTDARTQWDEYQRKRHETTQRHDRFPDL
ncbi:MAG: hypothetical protein FJY85_06800 [Deltaproteobacteria bacterium]|nr:hypothetical protein [Deltaproteobacteria bacterium]